VNLNLTILGQVVSFALFVWFCARYVWPPIVHAMQERERKIADGLAAADRAIRDLELAQERAAERLKEAKREAAGIVDQARRQAGSILDEAKAKAQEEAERIKLAAQAEIEREFNRAREELRNKVAMLAVAGAERILQREVGEAANSELVESLAAQL
jgi:F-type H+-transporting ATPase subunit b